MGWSGKAQLGCVRGNGVGSMATPWPCHPAGGSPSAGQRMSREGTVPALQNEPTEKRFHRWLRSSIPRTPTLVHMCASGEPGSLKTNPTEPIKASVPMALTQHVRLTAALWCPFIFLARQALQGEDRDGPALP